jgi:hypothetical protein
MTATDHGVTLDQVDRTIVMFVYRHRREHGQGPRWREVRDHLGMPGFDFGPDAFTSWRHAQGTDAFPSQRAARRAFVRVVRDADPLADRMYDLRRAGYLQFTRTERSLDVGWRVHGWLRSR